MYGTPPYGHLGNMVTMLFLFSFGSAKQKRISRFWANPRADWSRAMVYESIDCGNDVTCRAVKNSPTFQCLLTKPRPNPFSVWPTVRAFRKMLGNFLATSCISSKFLHSEQILLLYSHSEMCTEPLNYLIWTRTYCWRKQLRRNGSIRNG